MAVRRARVAHFEEDDTQTHGAYGLWPLVSLNSAVFRIFAFSFTQPKTACNGRSLGGFSAFVVALFSEMYGVPLTVYLLSGWLGRKFPRLDLLSHDAGHRWHRRLGLTGDPHGNPIHLPTNGLLVVGFPFLASAWRVHYAAQREGRLATAGPYARHGSGRGCGGHGRGHGNRAGETDSAENSRSDDRHACAFTRAPETSMKRETLLPWVWSSPWPRCSASARPTRPRVVRAVFRTPDTAAPDLSDARVESSLPGETRGFGDPPVARPTTHHPSDAGPS